MEHIDSSRREFLKRTGMAASAAAAGGALAGCAQDRAGGESNAVTGGAKSNQTQGANRIRSVMRLFASDVEDKSWYNDRDFWRRYLSMLAANRFNRFQLALGLGYDFASNLRDTYFYFAYPFLVSAPGYNVRASVLPDAERDSNLEMLRFISGEAARHGLHFQLGLWTHAYKWTNSPNVNYTIEGLTGETHAAYCRDALALLLKACPSISGVTFRIHGESGVPEGNYDFWKTVFDGVVRSGRRVEIDMHAKGMDQGMIDVALATGMPVNISPKFWAEHMGLPYHQAGIRPTEMPPKNRADSGFFSKSSGSRSFLRYGYGDLLKEDRKYGVLHRIWPGTQRVLLWGDPEFAAAYSRAFSFCGSDGVEIFEPMSFKGRKGSGVSGGRQGYADESLKTKWDWEKYAYAYTIWGHALYDPESSPDVWRAELKKQIGDIATPAAKALACASRVLPLITTAHCPSAANNNFWPEMYFNMPIVNEKRRHPYGDTPSPRRFGTVSPLDPELFSRIDDCADALFTRRVTGRYSPAEVAQWLEQLVEALKKNLMDTMATRVGLGTVPAEIGGVEIPNASSSTFRRLTRDVAIQGELGSFFSWKLRAGLLHAIYARTASKSALEEALTAYRKARDAWADLAKIAKTIYVADLTYGPEYFQRGNWGDRLAAIDQDIADMEELKSKLPPTFPMPSEQVIQGAIKAILQPPKRPDVKLSHTPAKNFRPGEAVELEFAVAERKELVTGAILHYRHVNQAELHVDEPMRMSDGMYRATVPAEYTNSPYPLQYYFELVGTDGRNWLYPGFEPSLCNQPYFVIRRRSA